MLCLLRLLPASSEFKACWIEGMKHFVIRIGDQPERVLCWTGTLTRSEIADVFGDGPVPRFVDISNGLLLAPLSPRNAEEADHSPIRVLPTDTDTAVEAAVTLARSHIG
jgi:hypothetical protein